MCLKSTFHCFCCQTSSGEVKIKEITTKAQRMECGEGPHWDIARQSLYFVDILDPAVFRYDTKSGKIYKATIKDDDSTISFIIPVENTTDEFVIGANRRLLLIHWNGKSSRVKVLKSLVEVDHAHTGNRINDGKVDPKGVLFFGSMGDESKFNLFETNVGTFYRFTNGTGARALKTNVGISNGLTWDAECRKFYYIDSVARDVKKFDYDPETSEISNESQLIDFTKTHKDLKFIPDGMTIDSEGMIYVATFGGSSIIVINPEKKEIIREIKMPTAQVTSLAFGGKNLDVLYVTTAAKFKPKPAPAGGLFKITGLGVKGLPMNNFKLY